MTTIHARRTGAKGWKLSPLLSDEQLATVVGGLLPPGFFQPVALISLGGDYSSSSGTVQGTGATASGTVNAAS